MRRVLSVLVVLLAACSSPTSVDSELLRVSAKANYVTLTNQTAEPVSYEIATTDYLRDPLLDRVCAIPEGCFKVLTAYAEVRIAYDTIVGYQRGGRRVIVNYFRGVRVVPPDGVQHVEIELR